MLKKTPAFLVESPFHKSEMGIQPETRTRNHACMISHTRFTPADPFTTHQRIPVLDRNTLYQKILGQRAFA